MSAFQEELERRLEQLQQQHLYRSLRQIDSAPGRTISVGGRPLLNFASNDYLGLANHPALKEAAIKALTDFGAGSGASRLVCGSLKPHHELEETISQFKNTEAALTFSTGYATALGAITALISKNDIIILDRLVHASIVDAAKLSGAKIRVFQHNDLNDLESILKWSANRRTSGANVLVVTESLFSMDGDFAPLREIVELKDRHGAWLMVDEAHSTGLCGERRRGWIEYCGVAGQVEIQMGTLGKAIGAAGGFITGSRKLIDYLINRARPFIFSTAPVPAASAAARAGFKILASKEGAQLLETLNARIHQFCGSRPQHAHIFPLSPIQPMLLGEETVALKLSDTLLASGIFAPAIRFPTVPRGAARIRFTFSAAHRENDILNLVGLLDSSPVGPLPPPGGPTSLRSALHAQPPSPGASHHCPEET